MPLPRRPIAIVFDMDGILFDTERLYRTAWFAAAADEGHVMTEALLLSSIGNPWPTTSARLVEHYGPDFAADAFRTKVLARFDALLPDELALKPGVEELLDALDAWGLPRAIATSSAHAAARHHLAAHALTHRFDHVVAFGDYAQGKPAPDPFLTAAARLGVDPALCVAVEDSHNGVRSASAAGMMTIMVPDLLDANDEMQALCVAIAPDLHAVRDLLHATLAHG
ncbi:HAD family phosphatase [Sphingobium sufflavum]|uniref:HAD family hydrolase n=1 Tax=Sphingobium sufflavum TaxID=1129547 RepID=UPI001F218114|nr:HAD family phosphatase [Sphingobium sufflavum]MCE7797695.1 HAD family phosphatase [Sphingobium sufflavum]